MTREQDIAQRMEIIMRIFSEAQTYCEKERVFINLALKLDETENEFRSVAYEAASMSIALDELEKDLSLSRWLEYKNGIGRKHASQVHAGLGWALAKRKISPAAILEKIDPLLQLKVIDGYGYYEGIFRHRSSVISKIIPAEIGAPLLPGFDQGIGRALYYNSKGMIDKIPAKISSFPETRQADLWRGVGMACIYVGGCDEKMFNDLFSLARKYAGQLTVSAALVSSARNDAESVTPYVHSACTYWCRCRFENVIDVTARTASILPQNDNAYKEWMLAIADQLSTAGEARV